MKCMLCVLNLCWTLAAQGTWILIPKLHLCGDKNGFCTCGLLTPKSNLLNEK